MTVKLNDKLKELPVSLVNSFVSKRVRMKTQKTSKGVMVFRYYRSFKSYLNSNHFALANTRY